MEIKQSLGNQMRILNNYIRQVGCKRGENMAMQNITMLHMEILSYLLDHQSQPVFQKEIEGEIEIGKSTLSEVINVMEKKDLLKRIPLKTDGRYRELILTETGKKIATLFEEEVEKFNEKLCAGISDEELKICINIIERMTENVKNIRGTNKGV